MAHDVFISHASEDKPTADAVCATLEGRGIRCWIAPRDILPGSDWGEAIIDAIEGARVMVLVFSAQTNLSRQVIREVERAVSKGLTIINLRIEDVQPARNLEYFLGTPHWLDALTPPLEQHLTYLADTVTFLLGQGERPGPLPRPRPKPSFADLLSRREVLLVGGGLVGLGAIAYLTGIIGGGGDGGSTGEVEAALVGDWNIESSLSNASDGSQTEWTVSQALSGAYSAVMIVRDEGGFNYIASSDGKGYLELSPARLNLGGSYARVPAWQQQGETAQVLTAALVPSSVLQMIAGTPNVGPSFLSNAEAFQRVSGGSGNSIVGRWEREADYGSMHWKIVFDVAAGNRYKLEATLSDSGKLSAQEGNWRQVSAISGLQEGVYEIVDESTIVFRNTGLSAFGPTAQVTWRRAGKRG